MKPNLSQLYALPLPPNSRGFFDPDKTRAWLYEFVVEGFTKQLNLVESRDFKLQVKDIEVQEPTVPITFKDQKQAILDKADITLPVKGTVQLIDKKSGLVIEEKRTIIARVPYITERNTAIMNGSEYITTHQQRLKPGVYTRIKSSGAGEAEAHINVLPGTGLGGKLIFYPDKAVFVYQMGTTGIKLYGLLKGLGVADDQMKSAWGNEIYLRNKATYTGNEIDKFYSKIFKYEE